MPRSVVPNEVIERDHELEGRSERATKALAKHRWQHTLDPDGPRYSFRVYADAVGRGEQTIRHYARGFELFLARAREALPGSELTIQDAVRLAHQGEEQREFTEAIAEGSGEPVANVARGDNRRRREIVDRARQRAERRGTNPVDEARDIAAQEARAAATRRTRAAEQREQRSTRFVHIEGHLAGAQRRLTEALREAEGVGFDDEEMELIRTSIDNIRAVLNLLDLRMAGNVDVDWDAELSRLNGGAS